MALQIQKEQLGPKHVDVATSYCNLGIVYQNTGDLEKEKEYYQLALEIKEEQLGPEHVDVRESYNNLCVIYEETCDLEKYYQMALEITSNEERKNN